MASARPGHGHNSAPKELGTHPEFNSVLLPDGLVSSKAEHHGNDDANYRYFTAQNLASSGYTESCMYTFTYQGRTFTYPRGRSWKTNEVVMTGPAYAGRLQPLQTSLRWRYFLDDAPSEVVPDVWRDTFAASDKTYVVQTSAEAIRRCILMTTDPGDLVLDPTCGSGTTAYVAEQWGRRWITIDTSRVALALARARIMGARYPHYILADSRDGQIKEAEPPACQSRRLVYSLARMAFPAWATYVYETGYFHGNGVPRHALNPGSQYLRRAPIGASGIRRRDDGLGRYRRLPVPGRQNQHPWASRRPVLSAWSMASRSVPKGPCHRLSGSREPFIPWPSLQRLHLALWTRARLVGSSSYTQ